MDAEALELLRRNSGLRLDAHGTFFSGGMRVSNERVQGLFHQSLGIRDNGDVTLTLGKVWAYVNTETVARFVTGLRRNGGLLEISLLDGCRLNVTQPRISVGPDDRFYLWETAEAYPAVLLRSAHYALGALLEECEDEIGFRLGDDWVSVGRLDASPGPSGR